MILFDLRGRGGSSLLSVALYRGPRRRVYLVLCRGARLWVRPLPFIRAKGDRRAAA